MTTISTLPYITSTALSKLLLSPSTSPAKLAIIDVRDSDHIGGHIRTSTHIPSGALDYQLPVLVRKLQSTETVVFHCALSQQRGPAAALRYIRERARLVGSDEAGMGQKVFVLEQGFVGWQEKFGEDERLTEGYVKELWEDGGGY